MKGSSILEATGREVRAGLNMTTTGTTTEIAISEISTTTKDMTATVITTVSSSRLVERLSAIELQ